MQKKFTHLFLFACTVLLLAGCKKDDPAPDEPDNTDLAAEAAAWYARESLTVSGDNTDDKNPTDGIMITYDAYNSITIAKFNLNFPKKTDGTSAIRYIPEIKSFPLTREGDRVIIRDTLLTLAAQSNMDEGTLALSGYFKGEVLTLNMELKSGEKSAQYVFTGLKKLNGGELESLSLTSDKIVIAPEIGTEKVSSNYPVIFYVKEGTTDAELNLIPTFKISDGATIQLNKVDYVPGTAVDFSTAQTLKVTSQSGKTTNTYLIKAEILGFNSGFETWAMKNANATGDNEYQKYLDPTDGWSTSNEGVKWIKLYPNLYAQEAPYAVTPGEDAHSGSKAARLETLNTTGQAGFGGFIPAIPVVTSGSIFTGEFSVVISNTLKSTKFGHPCLKKPVSFQGWYKYTPGGTYYYCASPADKANEVVEDNSKTDAPAINAVLYEVESYLTDYLDGTNLLTSPKIVARASLTDGKPKADWTSFNINFNWGDKQFDKTKKYKLAIVCSSSKDGDKFCGAPGSVLYVDDLKVTFE